jgi:hypothetical protein
MSTPEPRTRDRTSQRYLQEYHTEDTSTQEGPREGVGQVEVHLEHQ